MLTTIDFSLFMQASLFSVLFRCFLNLAKKNSSQIRIGSVNSKLFIIALTRRQCNWPLFKKTARNT